jgi:hypothetical protein
MIKSSAVLAYLGGLLTAASVYAAPPAGQDMKIEMQPTEVLTIGCQFVGRTVSSCAHTVTKLAGTDAAPTAIVTNGPTASTDKCLVTVAPASRHGRQYQIKLRATDSSSDKIECDILLVVRSVTYQPDEW